MSTIKELREVLEIYNEDNNSSFNLNSKANKKDIARTLQIMERNNNLEPWEAYCQMERDHCKIPASMIEIHPLNPRHSLDYDDQDLRNAIRRTGAKPIEVVKNNSGKYYVIAGNRSFYNLCKVVTAPINPKDPNGGYGSTLEEFEVDCIVVSYMGDELSVQAQILSDIEKDNTLTRQFTSIDNYNIVMSKRDQGLGQQQIAKSMGCGTNYIHNLMLMDLLPQRYRDLIHFNERSKDYEKLDVKHLKTFDVPFTIKSGVPKVSGISFSGAIKIAQTMPQPPSKRASRAYAEWLDTRDRCWIALMEENVIQDFINSSVDQCGVKARQLFESIGILEKQEVVDRVEKTEARSEERVEHVSYTSEPKMDDKSRSIFEEYFPTEEKEGKKEKAKQVNSEREKEYAQTPKPSKFDMAEIENLKDYTSDYDAFIPCDDTKELFNNNLTEFMIQLMSEEIDFSYVGMIPKYINFLIREDNKKAEQWLKLSVELGILKMID